MAPIERKNVPKSRLASFVDQIFPVTRSRPNFLVLGAMKGGTSSLNYCLRMHPEVHVASGAKETHFFDRHFERGEAWYLKHFPLKADVRHLGARAPIVDSTPYYLFHPVVPERVKRMLPDAMLIVLLRDPVERAISHYHHNIKKAREPLEIEEALRAENQRLAGEVERMMADPSYQSDAHKNFSYIARGLYRDQIEAWLRHFPQERFLFIRSDTFSRETETTFAEVCRFLGVKPIALPGYKPRNTGSYDAVSASCRKYLQERFFEPNSRLADLLGREFDFNMPPTR